MEQRNKGQKAISKRSRSSSSSTLTLPKKAKQENKHKKFIMNNNNNNNVKRHTTQQKKTTHANKDKNNNERYAVIITNVENDFSKIHEHLLQLHCHLDPTHQRSEFANLLSSSSLSSEPELLKQEQCQKLNAYKKNDKEEEEQFALDTRLTEDNTDKDDLELGNASVKTEITIDSKMNNKNKEQKIEEECMYELKCRNETRSAELTVYGTSLEHVLSIFLSPSSKAQRGNSNVQKFTSLKKMVNKVAHKPYFEHMLKFHVNTSECISQSTLSELNAALNKTESSTTSENNSETQEVSYTEHDIIIDANNNEIDHSDAKGNCDKHLAVQGKSSTQTSKATVLKQRDLVTAIAEISVSIPNTELRKRLADLPHFVTSWQIRPRTFRVVFANQQALFDAKQLLDQFELDGNVRVLLRLSDDLQSKFTSYIATANDDNIELVKEKSSE